MELTVHQQVLLAAFVIGAIMGAVANRTHFCTMGAVSDWINMDDLGRLRSWLLAIAVAIGGVLVLEATGNLTIGTSTFPPYRTPNLAWPRYILGGLMFGVGMTLASGCGNKTLVRVGAGNLKSLVVLAIAAVCSYLMLWTDFYATVFNSWLAPTVIALEKHGIRSQGLADVVGGLVGATDTHALGSALGWTIVAALAVFVFASRDFRASADHVLGGTIIGLAVVAGWYLTGGPVGQVWRDFAEMAAMPPSRVEVQSFTFISPMGDGLRYLMSPTRLELVNFGMMALAGVIAGSFVHAVVTRTFRVEWFAGRADFVRHALGAVLMGIGGVLSMGCTIGQAVTGMSTLALGSILTLVSIVAGSAATMKYQYWKLMREG